MLDTPGRGTFGLPPVGGTFWFQIFLRRPSPKIWSETISGGEEVLAGKWGGLFLGYLLRKKFIGSRGEAPSFLLARWQHDTTHNIAEGLEVRGLVRGRSKIGHGASRF